MGVCVCVFEKSQAVISRDCGDTIYTSSALASEWIFIEAVGCSSRGVRMDSYSNKASPWLRNAFVNLFQEVSNRIFYSRGVAVGCSSLGVKRDVYRAVGCSRLGVEIDLYRAPLWIKNFDFSDRRPGLRTVRPIQQKSSRAKS